MVVKINLLRYLMRYVLDLSVNREKEKNIYNTYSIDVTRSHNADMTANILNVICDASSRFST